MTFAIGKRILPKPTSEPSSQPQPELPPTLTQVRNYVQSLARSAASVMEGHSFYVSEQTATARAEICRSNVCGNYRQSDDKCGQCGCPIQGKTSRFAEFCPDHPRQWGPGEISATQAQ